MFFIIAYAMLDGVNTTRATEKNCRENINYMWILRGSSAPDHNTVARFISSCKIEIEDNANKYTFVWKKAINKFYEKLKIKVNNLRYL
ncbi:hypothetical protein HMPREF1552_01330 [Leptotrichia sp. oral taxon 879 str. F0557]|nr:hypothetical protein HMPREF1552_01330 [Leptotrichia sp. oral taxon 879 str. F0557]